MINKAVSLSLLMYLVIFVMIVIFALWPVQAEGQEQVVAQLERGATLYAWSCAVCHGDNGHGFDEARRAFPEDHQACERCHKPSNPKQMTLEQMTPHNAFSLGEAPPLVGSDSLQAFSTALSFYSYIQGTMPRYEPARHSSEEYLDITAYILKLRGVLLENPLTSDTVLSLQLR